MAKPAQPKKPKTKPTIDDSLIGTLGAYVAEGGRISGSRELMGGPGRAQGKTRGHGRPQRVKG